MTLAALLSTSLSRRLALLTGALLSRRATLAFLATALLAKPAAVRADHDGT